MSEKFMETQEQEPQKPDLQWEIDTGSLIASEPAKALELVLPNLGIPRMVERAGALSKVFEDAGLLPLSVSLQPSMSIKVPNTLNALQDVGIGVGSFDSPEKRNIWEFLQTAHPTNLPEHIAYQLGFCMPTQHKWDRTMQDVLQFREQVVEAPLIVRTPSTFWNSNPRMGDALVAAIVRSGMNTVHNVHIAIELNPWDDGLTFTGYVNKMLSVSEGLKDQKIRVGMSFDTGHVEQVLNEQGSDPELTPNAVAAFRNVIAAEHGDFLFMVELDQVRRENGNYRQHTPLSEGDVNLRAIMYEYGRLRKSKTAGIPVAHAVIETDPRAYTMLIEPDSAEIRFIKTLQDNYLMARY
jgi:hypothetical protein